MSSLEQISDQISDLTTDEAALLIERLVKIHGGEILDYALDRMIDADERGDWPETVQ